MKTMIFSYNDFQTKLANHFFDLPKYFIPYSNIQRAEYKALEDEHLKKDNNINKVFREVRKRVRRGYFERLYAVQTQMLEYAQTSFPAYRFILPEVITDDWLATVDWHKFQRDHVLHQPLTAYIVSKLLKRGTPFLDRCIDQILTWDGTAYIKEYLINTGLMKYPDSDAWLGKNQLGRDLWKRLFLETAYLAASFHDIGYPWQYINVISNKLDHADPTDITMDASKIVTDFGDRLLFCPFNGYRFLDRATPSTWRDKLTRLVSQALQKTHGFPGAICFLYLNDRLKGFPPERRIHPARQLCVEWAATAIMMHDMSKFYWGDDGTQTPPENPQMRLRFQVDPLSCILTLADLLQDFERPEIKFSPQRTSVVYSKFEAPCRAAKLIFTADEMTISYQFNQPLAREKKNAFLQNEQEEYFNVTDGFIDLSGCGFHKITMKTE